MKKTGQLIFNIFWVILIGLPTAISSAVAGASLCLTIIGIPLGLQYFKYIKLVFAPAGKEVAIKFSRHPVLNTLWLIFGGLEVAVIYLIVAFVFCFTIIGVPIGHQLIKIAVFMLAPFGAEIVNENEYSTNKDTAHDRQLLYRRMAADKKLKEKLTVGRKRAQQLYDHKLNPNKVFTPKHFLIFFIPFVIIINVINIFLPFEVFLPVLITIGIIFCGICIAWPIVWYFQWKAIQDQLDIAGLIEQYPNGAPTIEGVIALEELYPLAGLIENLDPKKLEAIKSRATKLEK